MSGPPLSSAYGPVVGRCENCGSDVRERFARDRHHTALTMATAPARTCGGRIVPLPPTPKKGVVWTCPRDPAHKVGNFPGRVCAVCKAALIPEVKALG